LGGCAQEDGVRTLQQGAEIDHGSHPDEDEERKELRVDAGFPQHGEEATRFGEPAEGDVRQDDSHSDGNEEHRLHLLGDTQIDEEAAEPEHDGGLPGQGENAQKLAFKHPPPLSLGLWPPAWA